ncbi:J domain-containing protein [Chloropicon primus]|uniref:J domain-containing protein n=1 Tax=Chloropicon primus TaxID=1764295 RepID=A0A5B8MKW7_9CHLO|nr:hypothetical protein A3770_05p36250 [Chloropicon primus]UPR00321.1 J domain-containing protein [Chloropicon primus]|eukprot:QDZ21107.1 hypothetical protein A3770_05p36250 [Chloropicon primus]
MSGEKEKKACWTREDVKSLLKTIGEHGTDDIEVIMAKGGESLRGRSTTDVREMCEALFQGELPKRFKEVVGSPERGEEDEVEEGTKLEGKEQASSNTFENRAAGKAGRSAEAETCFSSPSSKRTCRRRPDVIEISSGSEDEAGSVNDDRNDECEVVSLSSDVSDVVVAEEVGGTAVFGEVSSTRSECSSSYYSESSEEASGGGQRAVPRGRGGGEGQEAEGPEAEGPSASHGKEHQSFMSPQERIKETDDYKRADEEEWNRRNEVIRQQSLRAKLIREKKREQNLRVEKQKESNLRIEKRLLELKTQLSASKKQVEEADTLRPKIRSHLNRVLMGSKYFPVVAQRLGLTKTSGPHSEAELTKVYRKALLKYHPDRASRTSTLKEKVYNEEVFKVLQTAFKAFKH